jgi:hypothetical protein
MANLLGHCVHRWNVVEYLTELATEALVRSIEQRAENEQTRAKLPAAIQFGSELEDLFQRARGRFERGLTTMLDAKKFSNLAERSGFEPAAPTA